MRIGEIYIENESVWDKINNTIGSKLNACHISYNLKQLSYKIFDFLNKKPFSDTTEWNPVHSSLTETLLCIVQTKFWYFIPRLPYADKHEKYADWLN